VRDTKPVTAKYAEAVFLEGAGLGLQRDLTISGELQARVDITEQPVFVVSM
jgi:hypothetical protein